MIRDQRSTKSNDIVITSISGGSIAEVTEECQNTSETFKEVILAIGGNDCLAKVDVQVLLQQYSELVDSVMKVSGAEGTVKISSVCPPANVKTHKTRQTERESERQPLRSIHNIRRDVA